ncbi:hypothetical protein J6590_067653 [Homalodisca vitripennis]|nr:hypothetical protein J6590_067653 [Homalodisca vitripennis]
MSHYQETRATAQSGRRAGNRVTVRVLGVVSAKCTPLKTCVVVELPHVQKFTTEMYVFCWLYPSREGLPRRRQLAERVVIGSPPTPRLLCSEYPSVSDAVQSVFWVAPDRMLARDVI